MGWDSITPEKSRDSSDFFDEAVQNPVQFAADQRLHRLIERWPGLPESVRLAILSLGEGNYG